MRAVLIALALCVGTLPAHAWTLEQQTLLATARGRLARQAIQHEIELRRERDAQRQQDEKLCHAYADIGIGTFGGDPLMIDPAKLSDCRRRLGLAS